MNDIFFTFLLRTNLIFLHFVVLFRFLVAINPAILCGKFLFVIAHLSCYIILVAIAPSYCYIMLYYSGCYCALMLLYYVA